MNHKEEIIQTRSVGLGSSDAKMVVRVAKCGLNDSAKQRIAQMLGLEERKQFTTKAIEKGNYIEDHIYKALSQRYPDLKSNPYYESEALSERFGFKVFNHIDYEYEDDESITWFEVKATEANTETTFNNYWEQFAWHVMLLNEKADKLCKQAQLYLVHYNTNDGGEFKPENLTVEEELWDYDHTIEKIHHGLQLISDALPSFKYEPKEELYAENLPVEYNQQVAHVAVYLQDIKNLTEKVEEFKSKICALMKEHNIKSIKNDLFGITFIPESVSTTFDSSSFKKKHPDLYEQFVKQSKRKEYVKFT